MSSCVATLVRDFMVRMASVLVSGLMAPSRAVLPNTTSTGVFTQPTRSSLCL